MGEELMGEDEVAVVLGEKMFEGEGLWRGVKEWDGGEGGMIFGYEVWDAEGYGVVEFEWGGAGVWMEEKRGGGKWKQGVVGL